MCSSFTPEAKLTQQLFTISQSSPTFRPSFVELLSLKYTVIIHRSACNISIKRMTCNRSKGPAAQAGIKLYEMRAILLSGYFVTYLLEENKNWYLQH